MDVTGYVTGNGLYSLALTSGTSNTLRWRSREHANAPQLIITTSGGSAGSGPAEYVSWRGYAGSAAYPTPTPGGHRPLKRGPSEPRWRSGEAPNLEVSRNITTTLGKPNLSNNASTVMQSGNTIAGRAYYLSSELIPFRTAQVVLIDEASSQVTAVMTPDFNGVYVFSDLPSGLKTPEN